MECLKGLHQRVRCPIYTTRCEAMKWQKNPKESGKYPIWQNEGKSCKCPAVKGTPGNEKEVEDCLVKFASKDLHV